MKKAAFDKGSKLGQVDRIRVSVFLDGITYAVEFNNDPDLPDPL